MDHETRKSWGLAQPCLLSLVESANAARRLWRFPMVFCCCPMVPCSWWTQPVPGCGGEPALRRSWLRERPGFPWWAPARCPHYTPTRFPATPILFRWSRGLPFAPRRWQEMAENGRFFSVARDWRESVSLPGATERLAGGSCVPSLRTKGLVGDTASEQESGSTRFENIDVAPTVSALLGFPLNNVEGRAPK